MGIVDELQKLEQLRKSGALTDAEFAQAKTLLLANPPTPTNLQIGPILEDQLAEVRYQNELARIDREWEIQRTQFQIVGRYGRVYTPTIGSGIGTALIGGVFGAFWTAMAYSTTHFFPNEGPFAISKIVFPLLGLVFTAAAVVYGIYCIVRAQKYNEAYLAYKNRHNRASSTSEFA